MMDEDREALLLGKVEALEREVKRLEGDREGLLLGLGEKLEGI
jgi:hypothetical protein